MSPLPSFGNKESITLFFQGTNSSFCSSVKNIGCLHVVAIIKNVSVAYYDGSKIFCEFTLVHSEETAQYTSEMQWQSSSWSEDKEYNLGL